MDKWSGVSNIPSGQKVQEAYVEQYRRWIFAKGLPVEMEGFVLRNCLIISIVSIVCSVVLIRFLHFFDVDLRFAISIVNLAVVAIAFGGLKSHGFSFSHSALIAWGIGLVVGGADNVFEHIGSRVIFGVLGFWIAVRFFSEGPASTPSDKIAPRR
jgi:hypothetical protein